MTDAQMADDRDDDPEVLAAGGVVWRTRLDGGPVEVLLVHRPRYDDWSLPKGKVDAGESLEEAALREVEEETGVRGRLGADLGEVRYVDSRGRDKLVRWWAIRAEDVPERLAAADPAEVDEVRWVALDEAAGVTRYDTDRTVLDRFRRYGVG